VKDAGAPSPAGLTRPPALWDTFTIDLIEIRRQLLVHGWSLTDLAQKALVSVTTASRFVRGLSVNPRSAYRIINTLGLRPDELIVARDASAIAPVRRFEGDQTAEGKG
jgi:transcriptional regulator with XRE-family HTH domain